MLNVAQIALTPAAMGLGAKGNEQADPASILSVGFLSLQTSRFIQSDDCYILRLCGNSKSGKIFGIAGLTELNTHSLSGSSPTTEKISLQKWDDATWQIVFTQSVFLVVIEVHEFMYF